MAAQVRHGTAATPVADQYVGKSVRELRQILQGELDIQHGSPAVVSKDGGVTSMPVAEDYIVQDGDLLEFVRTAGAKGNTFDIAA